MATLRGFTMRLKPLQKAATSDGEELVIERDQTFDWFVSDDGLLCDGYTMRVARWRMADADRASFDAYTGVRQWVDTNHV